MAKTEPPVRDEHYELVSILFHALQGAETLEEYIDDAEEAGDEELSDHFRDLLEKYREIVFDSKELLKEKLMLSGDDDAGD